MGEALALGRVGYPNCFGREACLVWVLQEVICVGGLSQCARFYSQQADVSGEPSGSTSSRFVEDVAPRSSVGISWRTKGDYFPGAKGEDRKASG